MLNTLIGGKQLFSLSIYFGFQAIYPAPSSCYLYIIRVVKGVYTKASMNQMRTHPHHFHLGLVQV